VSNVEHANKANINSCTEKVKGKGRYSSSWEPHLRAVGRHLPYGIIITHCYLPPNTSERNAPRLKPTMLAGTWFTYPGGMEGWVDL